MDGRAGWILGCAESGQDGRGDWSAEEEGAQRRTPAVLLLPNVARALEQLRNLNGSSIWMFPSDRTGKPYSRLFFVYALRRACERAGIKIEGRFIDCHSFRHTFNTVIKPVVAQNITQALLGHKSPMMTDLYDHPSLESKMRQLEAVKDVIAAAFDVK